MRDPRLISARIQSTVQESLSNAGHHLRECKIASMEGARPPRGSMLFLGLVGSLSLAQCYLGAMSLWDIFKALDVWLSGWEFACWNGGPLTASIVSDITQSVFCGVFLLAAGSGDSLDSVDGPRYRTLAQLHELREASKGKLARLREREDLGVAAQKATSKAISKRL